MSVPRSQAPMRACGDGMTSDAESRVTEWVENINQSGHGGGDGGHGLGQEALSVDRLCLALGDLLQEGTFGRVYQVRHRKKLNPISRSNSIQKWTFFKSTGCLKNPLFGKEIN